MRALASRGKPGATAEPLSTADVVQRLAVHTPVEGRGEIPKWVSPLDFELPKMVSIEDFALSTADRKTKRQWLSVFERSLTSPEQNATLMQKSGLQLVLCLRVGEIRGIRIPQCPDPRLNVFWDRRDDCHDPETGRLNDRKGSGAAGHCGIHGLSQDHHPDIKGLSSRQRKDFTKAIRFRLAKLAERAEAQELIVVETGERTEREG